MSNNDQGNHSTEPDRLDFWRALQRFRQQLERENVAIAPSTFEGVRDQSPGREVDW